MLKSFIHLFSDYRHDSLDNVSIRRSQAFTTRNNQYQVIDYGFEGGIIGKKYILLHASRNFFPIGIVNIGLQMDVFKERNLLTNKWDFFVNL